MGGIAYTNIYIYISTRRPSHIFILLVNVTCVFALLMASWRRKRRYHERDKHGDCTTTGLKNPHCFLDLRPKQKALNAAA